MTIDQSKINVPERTGADYGYATIRAVISAIPLAGGSAVEVLAALVIPPIERRRDAWMKGVSEALIALDDTKHIDLAALSNDPRFIDGVLGATRIALRTSKEDKLVELRNVVLNSALGCEPDEFVHEILLNQIEGLTAAHIAFLRFIEEHGTWATSNADGFVWELPILKDSPLLYRAIWKDLFDRGLIDGDAVPTPQKPTITCSVTELGSRLVRLISAPRGI